MTNPNNSRNDDIASAAVDRIAGRLLDDDAMTDRDAADLADEERRRLIDLQWLDALLEHSSGKNQQAIERGLSQVLARLQEGPKVHAAPPPRADVGPGGDQGSIRRPTLPRWIGSLFAAAVLVVVGLIWWQQSPNAASAMVEQAYRAALRPTDRTYRVLVDYSAPGRPFSEGTLTVQGGTKFLFERTGPLGRQLRIGSDGTEYWLIPPIGPVLTGDSSFFAVNWLNSPQSADMPFLQVTTILQRLRDHYQLTLLPDEPLEAGGPTFRHLRAQRRQRPDGDPVDGPVSVELWADPTSGTVRKIVFVRPYRPMLSEQRQTITLDLIEERQLPDDFYQHQTYAAERSVVPLPDRP